MNAFSKITAYIPPMSIASCRAQIAQYGGRIIAYVKNHTLSYSSIQIQFSNIATSAKSGVTLMISKLSDLTPQQKRIGTISASLLIGSVLLYKSASTVMSTLTNKHSTKVGEEVDKKVKDDDNNTESPSSPRIVINTNALTYPRTNIAASGKDQVSVEMGIQMGKQRLQQAKNRKSEEVE